MRRSWRLFVFVWLGPVVASLAATAAYADSAFCQGLQNQYLVLQRQSVVGRGDAQTLARKLGQAQAAAQNGKCNRLFLFVSPQRSPACPAIMATIGQLQRQLASARGQGFGGFGSTSDFDQARLRNALIQNGCSIPTAIGSGGSRTRTLCVRVCDGYYFPISNGTRRSRYAIDAAVCQSMYAAEGQAELFVQSSGADVKRAVSLSGKRYADQDYAFGYREAYDAACHSQLKTGISALAVRYRTAPPMTKAGEVVLTISATKPSDSVQDPVAVEVGSVVVPKANHAPSSDVQPEAAASHSVRLVGDAYYGTLFDLSRAEPMKRERRRRLLRAGDSVPGADPSD